MQLHDWILAIAVFTTMLVVSDSCSCSPTHPQEQYCKADFVIRARVKKGYIQNATHHLNYKVRISKEYKMSEKAKEALKDGKLFSPPDGATCGVFLKQGEVYVISGFVKHLQAHISLCTFHEQWPKISKRQRRGFQRMYQLGCNSCKIKLCRKNSCGRKSKHVCNWTTFSMNKDLDCDRMQGICLPSKTKSCSWIKNKPQISCLKNHTDSSLYAAYLKSQKSKSRKQMLKLSLNEPS